MKHIGKMMLFGVMIVSLFYVGFMLKVPADSLVEEEALVAFKVIAPTEAPVEAIVVADVEETIELAPATTVASNNKPVQERVIADRSGRDSKSPAPAPTAVPAEEKPVKAPLTELIPEPAPALPQGSTVTYLTHTVVDGDSFWQISQKYGVPMAELLTVNQLTESTPINVGMKLTVPQYNIPQKSTPGPQFGELMDWWTEAQYFWPIGTDARIIDFKTGKSFMARRTVGAFHADVEPLTAEDARLMQEIWGGWSWNTRPVIVEVKGRRLAASANGMPHNIQTITNNNFNGHFCIHFLNSTRHVDNLVQADHQQNVRTAAGQ